MSAARRLELFAPAKLNLGLRIVGRRDDGYHLLDSVFAPLAWGDAIELEERPRSAEIPDGPTVRLELHPEPPFAAGLGAADALPVDDRNLAVRAARRFCEEARVASAIELRMHKRVPAGAGLGGGSSDAAAVLRGLARLHPGAVEPKRLLELALELGADVPFFMDPRPSRVRGVGERIEPLADAEALEGWWLTLANPGKSVATAEVYAGFDQDHRECDAVDGALTGSGAGPTMRPFSGLLADPPALAALLQNDLEPAASRLCPAIQDAKQQLDGAGAVASGMSGSGATVFGVFAGEAAAQAGRGAFEDSGQCGGWALVTRIRTRWPGGREG